MKFQFPHFSQLKNARLLFGLEMPLLWIALMSLIAINILSTQRMRPAYWNKLMMLFETPFSVDRHIDLASYIWNQGNKHEARQLIASAETGSVLGATTDPKSVLAQWEKEADERNKQYAFWKSVATAKPDYRDAYIQLASLAYQLKKIDEARAWIAKAVTLDPNSPTTLQLSKIIK